MREQNRHHRRVLSVVDAFQIFFQFRQLFFPAGKQPLQLFSAIRVETIYMMRKWQETFEFIYIGTFPSVPAALQKDNRVFSFSVQFRADILHLRIGKRCLPFQPRQHGVVSRFFGKLFIELASVVDLNVLGARLPKQIVANCCYILRERYIRQALAVGKRLISNARHAVGNHDACQAAAIVKCTLPNARHAVRYCDTRQILAKLKRLISDARHTVWDDNLCGFPEIVV